jgi:hypothetical protein
LDVNKRLLAVYDATFVVVADVSVPATVPSVTTRLPLARLSLPYTTSPPAVMVSPAENVAAVPYMGPRNVPPLAESMNPFELSVHITLLAADAEMKLNAELGGAPASILNMTLLKFDCEPFPVRHIMVPSSNSSGDNEQCSNLLQHPRAHRPVSDSPNRAILSARELTREVLARTALCRTLTRTQPLGCVAEPPAGAQYVLAD